MDLPASNADPALGSLAPGSYGSSFHDSSLAPAADASALVMIALIFFLLGCFAAWGFALYRRSMRPRPWHADLTDPSPQDLREKNGNLSVAEQSDQLASWEQRADWWK